MKICGNSFTSKNGRLKCDKCYIPRPKCPHGTKKGRCKIDGCDGNEICDHKNHKQKCHICKPNMHIVDNLNAKIISFMKGKKIQKKL